MIGWIIGGAGVVLALATWWGNRQRPAVAPLAIPASPLASRLQPLLGAIAGVQAVARELTPRELMLCAPSQWERAPPAEGEDRLRPGDVGPGRWPFFELHGALSQVEPDDRRALARAGFDLARLESALEPDADADRWRAQLLLTFEQLERALSRASDPYR